MINEKVFKAYDIRGIYPNEINEDLAYNIGRSFVTFLKEEKPKIVLGRDGRKSSPSILQSLKKGVIDSGGVVVDIGISNTPLLNFVVAKFKYSGGMMVTASHNPPEFNGIKIIKKNGLQVYGQEIQKIKEIILEKDFKKGEGCFEEKNYILEYENHILSFSNDYSNLRVVIDCGNGVGSVTARPVFSKLNSETLFLYDKIDGSFPNHLPDPHDEKSSQKIKEEIKERKANIGAIFDGDGDRCILLDENGEIVSTDHLLCLLASEELTEALKEEIYYDLRFSMVTSEVIKEKGGIPIMMRVGNPFYKEKIIKEGGLLGAELSGHIMFRENFGIDDGLFALIKTLNILSKRKKKLSELLLPFKKYFQTEEINLKVNDKKIVLEKVKNSFQDGEELFIDGVYIKYNDWWFNLRESNTEDLVRLRIEAKTKEILEEKKEKIISIIES